MTLDPQFDLGLTSDDGSLWALGAPAHYLATNLSGNCLLLQVGICGRINYTHGLSRSCLRKEDVTLIHNKHNIYQLIHILVVH